LRFLVPVLLALPERRDGQVQCPESGPPLREFFDVLVYKINWSIGLQPERAKGGELRKGTELLNREWMAINGVSSSIVRGAVYVYIVVYVDVLYGGGYNRIKVCPSGVVVPGDLDGKFCEGYCSGHY